MAFTKSINVWFFLSATPLDWGEYGGVRSKNYSILRTEKIELIGKIFSTMIRPNTLDFLF